MRYFGYCYGGLSDASHKELKLQTKRVVFRNVAVEELSDALLLSLNQANADVLRFPTLNWEELYIYEIQQRPWLIVPGYYAQHVATHEDIFKVLRFEPPALPHSGSTMRNTTSTSKPISAFLKLIRLFLVRI